MEILLFAGIALMYYTSDLDISTLVSGKEEVLSITQTQIDKKYVPTLNVENIVHQDAFTYYLKLFGLKR